MTYWYWGEDDAPGLEKGEAQLLLGQPPLDAWEVAALRKPEAAGAVAEEAGVLGRAHRDLGVQRLLEVAQQRKEGMGGGARHQRDLAGALRTRKPREEVSPVVLLPAPDEVAQPVPVVTRQRGEPRVLGRPSHLPLPQLALLAKAGAHLGLQASVLQHGQ